MKAPWSKDAPVVDAKDPLAQAPAAPIDPLSRPHVIIAGSNAVKVFDWVTKLNRDRDLGARCRMWQAIHAWHPETREGRWEMAVGLVDIVVYRMDEPAKEATKEDAPQ